MVPHCLQKKNYNNNNNKKQAQTTELGVPNRYWALIKVTRIGADTALRNEGVLDSSPVLKGLNLDDLRSRVEDCQEKLPAWPGGSVSWIINLYTKRLCVQFQVSAYT